MKKVLIVNPFGIGDVLFTTPLIAALKRRDPGVSISFIGNARTAPMLQNDPRLDKVYSYERDEFVAVYKRSPWQFLLKWKAFTAELYAGNFDTAFDLSMGSPVGAALMLAGIPQRIGFDHKGRGRWLTRKVPLKGYEGRHVAAYYLDLLEPHPGDEDRMALFVPEADAAWAGDFISGHGLSDNAFIVIFPGGGASWGRGAGMKRWPPEGYARLAEKIIERSKCPIILMGDASEQELCQRIAGMAASPRVAVSGPTSLMQAAALMRRAKFALVNDGGPLHVGVACGARTVSIFGPVDPVVYGPYPLGKAHRVVTKGLPCQPCYRNFRMSGCAHQSCLRTLTMDEVYRALEEFVS